MFCVVFLPFVDGQTSGERARPSNILTAQVQFTRLAMFTGEVFPNMDKRGELFSQQWAVTCTHLLQPDLFPKALIMQAFYRAKDLPDGKAPAEASQFLSLAALHRMQSIQHAISSTRERSTTRRTGSEF